MAKTFDNISEASATNYLFLFAQRTLALQNEPPTPPPLNALGLPCHAVCLLWARLYPQKAAAHQHLSTYLSFLAACGVAAAEKAIKVQKQKRGGGESSGDESSGDEGSGDEGSGDEDTEDEFWDWDAFAHKIEPLAEKITKYINDHQDDAAQEDRWRTTMKRETMKRFREQREAIETQGQAIAEVRQAIDQQREATAEVHRLIVKLGDSLGLASADGGTTQVGAEMEHLEC